MNFNTNLSENKSQIRQMKWPFQKGSAPAPQHCKKRKKGTGHLLLECRPGEYLSDQLKKKFFFKNQKNFQLFVVFRWKDASQFPFYMLHCLFYKFFSETKILKFSSIYQCVAIFNGDKNLMALQRISTLKC